MYLTNESLSGKYQELLYNDADPRTRDKPLMGSPLLIIMISISYVVLIKVALVKFMESRKAFDMRFVSLALNLYLFSVSTFFFYKCCVLGWLTTYSWRCEPLDRSNSEIGKEVNYCTYIANDVI